MTRFVAGVEPQTETVCGRATSTNVPRWFRQQLDRTGEDFLPLVDAMIERLGRTPLVLQIPIGAEYDSSASCDLWKCAR